MVRYFSDRVAVMYLGRIVEIGSTKTIFEKPNQKSNQNVRSINLLIKSSTSKNATIKDGAGNILAYKIIQINKL